MWAKLQRSWPDNQEWYCQVNFPKGNQPVSAAYYTDAHHPSLSSSSLPAEIISHCVWLYFRFALSLSRRRGNASHARCRPYLLELSETHQNESRTKTTYFGFRSLESLFLSIRILLPAVCLVMRIVDIWTRKHDAIFSQRLGPQARKIESLSRSEMGP